MTNQNIARWDSAATMHSVHRHSCSWAAVNSTQYTVQSCIRHGRTTQYTAQSCTQYHCNRHGRTTQYTVQSCTQYHCIRHGRTTQYTVQTGQNYTVHSTELYSVSLYQTWLTHVHSALYVHQWSCITAAQNKLMLKVITSYTISAFIQPKALFMLKS